MTIVALMASHATGGIAPQVWHVDAGAGNAGDGVTWETPFVDLQDALAAAQPGDEIWVRAGIYTPSTTDATLSFNLVPGVSVYGGFTGIETLRAQRDWQANLTTLSGDVGGDDIFDPFYQRVGSNSGHVLVGSAVDATVILDGFTIAYGAIGPTGILSNDPLMHGSGLYCFGGAPTVRNCVFSYNSAAFNRGGAVFLYDADGFFENCRFEFNSVHISSGGGIFSGGTSSLVVTDCVFYGNACTSAIPDASGGGLYHQSSGTATLTRCTFENNSVTPFPTTPDSPAYGGGVSIFGGPATITDCLFKNNRAGFGGGLMAWDAVTVTNCLFDGNRAIETPAQPFDNGGFAGAFMSNSFSPDIMTLNNCTFVNNRAEKYAAVYGGWNSTSVLNNCILWGNIAANPEVSGSWKGEISGNFDLTNCCVALIFEPSAPGEDPPDPKGLPGVIDVDPLFVDFANGDFHLSNASPCVDTGNTLLVPAGITTDFDGAMRIVDALGGGAIVDMGCYEFTFTPSCPGDADGNGVVNLGDLNLLLLQFGLAGQGLAGDLNNDGSVDLNDLQLLLFAFGTVCG